MFAADRQKAIHQHPHPYSSPEPHPPVKLGPSYVVTHTAANGRHEERKDGEASGIETPRNALHLSKNKGPALTLTWAHQLQYRFLSAGRAVDESRHMADQSQGSN